MAATLPFSTTEITLPPEPAQSAGSAGNGCKTSPTPRIRWAFCAKHTGTSAPNDSACLPPSKCANTAAASERKQRRADRLELQRHVGQRADGGDNRHQRCDQRALAVAGRKEVGDRGGMLRLGLREDAPHQSVADSEDEDRAKVNGQVVPAGQTGMQDIEAAMDNLFNHNNVGPFISRRLIQNLVKSNPSPAYISRVATAFANNGQGQRGDMKAVIKAILLDPEARDCEYATTNDIGKLRSPLARYLHALRAFKVNSPSNTFWDDGYLTEMQLQQAPMRANSVFNFYLPDYQPNGPIAESDQFGPEFQIHNSTTSISYGNLLYTMLFEGESLFNLKPELVGVGAIETDNTKPISLNFTAEDAIAGNLNALLDRLDILLTNGNLSTNTRNIILNALNQMESEDTLDIRNTAIFLIMLSPDYAILK